MEILKDNLMLIVMFALTFLVGIGVGAVVNKIISEWGNTHDKV